VEDEFLTPQSSTTTPLVDNMLESNSAPEQSPAVPEQTMPEQSLLPEPTNLPEQSLPEPTADNNEQKIAPEQSGVREDPPGFLVNHVQSVPVFGQYAGAVLGHRWAQPFVKVADPYVQTGVEKVTPYAQAAYQRPIVQNKLIPVVEGGIQKLTPVYTGSVKTVGAVAAVPGRVYSTVKAAPGQVISTVRAAPGQVYGKSVAVASSAATTAGPYATSAANTAQPYVHKGVGILGPYVESAVAHPRVQSVYQHRIVQSSVEKAKPYVTPVVDSVQVQAVRDWARPTMVTADDRPRAASS
jgi:hypothetical protein